MARRLIQESEGRFTMADWDGNDHVIRFHAKDGRIIVRVDQRYITSLTVNADGSLHITGGVNVQ